MNDLCDPFITKIRKTSADTFEVTIPINIIRFEGWKEGDELRLNGHKIVPKEE